MFFSRFFKHTRAAQLSLVVIVLFTFSSCALLTPESASLHHFNTVILDPGHGGYDSGARSTGGLEEKRLTLDVAQRLRPLLQREGYHVIMTRNSDTFIPLGMRTAISNAHPEAIFVSIHCNSSPRSAAHGIETYYYNNGCIPLAATILHELPAAYGGQQRGVKKACYFVLHQNRRPATLLELGFISNRRENSFLQNPLVREHLAEQIAKGITKVRNQ